MHAIIIDDDPVTRSLIQAQVESFGLTAEAASNADEGMRRMNRTRPDLCIVDWMMPGTDGLTFVRDLRGNTELESIYTIMVTAKSEMQELIVAFRAGVDDYIRKPVHRGELSARLRAAVRLIDLQNERAKHLDELRELNDKLVFANKRLQNIASTDDLTGLPNRRSAIDGLSRMWSQWERYRCPFTVAIADIDHFKAINDTMGHLIGDEVIRQIAAIFRAHTRDADQLGRYGGEEFIFGMPGQDRGSASAAFDRIRAALAQQAILVNGKPLVVSMSVGIMEAGGAVQSLDDMIRLADDALYRAKHAGRNQVCFAAA